MIFPPPPAMIPQENLPPAPPAALVSLRVYVVEDHADTLLALRRLLTRLGCMVLQARDMEEALTALPEADCDVLLSDIGLPDGDGWQLLRKAAPLLPRPLVAIAMSGYGEAADCARSREAGYHHHLIKPLRPEELKTLLAEVVKLKEAG